jgi:TonB family protein
MAEQAQRERMAQLQKEREALRRREEELQAKERRLRDERQRVAQSVTQDQGQSLPEGEIQAQESRLEREAEVRRSAILEEQEKLAAAARERAEIDARKRRDAEEAAARARELDAWKLRIHDRIKSKLMLPPGVPDSARAEYSITIIPGGEVLTVKLRRSSGYPAYDAAIERAISAAAPLPVPSDPDLFKQLRELLLVFMPGTPKTAQREIIEPDPMSLQRGSAPATKEALVVAQSAIAEHIAGSLPPVKREGKIAVAKYRIRIFTDSGFFHSAVPTQRSGSAEFDAVAERAILLAEPLPLPAAREVRRELRDLDVVLWWDGTVQVFPVPETALAPSVPSEPLVRAEPRPSPPPAQKPEPVDEGALDRFALEIQSRLGKLMQERGERAYPRLARERKWEGVAQIAVEFGANGQLKRIAVVESSGYAVLDQRAVEMVREVLPTVPRELQARNFTVRLPILFKLKEKS